MTDAVHLSKHHGLGNDFLVLVDVDRDTPVDAATARRLCDRRLGVGADGLIRVVPATSAAATGDAGADRADGADVAMELRNADGSVAEMSGNGIRCLAQAVARHRGVDTLDLAVATLAGVRRVRVGPAPEDDPATAWVEVDMGPARPGPQGWEAALDVAVALRATTVDLGNPHLVLLVDDPAAVDLPTVGTAAQAGFAQGVNVELVAPVPGRPDVLDLVVWERGVGATSACGTGACAAAHAAHRWGLVGPRVQVAMPGGQVTVTLGAGVQLAGPATFVADVVVARSLVGAGGRTGRLDAPALAEAGVGR